MDDLPRKSSSEVSKEGISTPGGNAILKHLSDGKIPWTSDVCIVGAGPVGIALALALERRGLSVLILESGEAHDDRSVLPLTAGHRVDRRSHAPPAAAMRRGLGGTSHWWGGRCVPYDDVDFADRPYLPEAAWPIPHDEIARWYGDAAQYFGIGSSIFEEPAKHGCQLGVVCDERLERWAPQKNMGTRHRVALETSDRVCLVLGATVADITMTGDGRRIEALQISGKSGTHHLKVNLVVLACGGLETTRLLLVMQQRHGNHFFGGPDGPLGRYYMGHIYGEIADFVFSDVSKQPLYDFYLDGGSYARRRFSLRAEAQLRNGLLNAAFWIDNPSFANPAHRSGALSLTWIALATKPLGRMLASEGIRLAHVGAPPYEIPKHIFNVLKTPLRTAIDIIGLVHSRYFSSPRRPGFILHNNGARFALHYHAEQAPNSQSRVTLSDSLDEFGTPFLDVKLIYSEGDAISLVRSHEIFDETIRKAGFGGLEFYDDRFEDRVLRTLSQARDGFHQVGTTRMSADPRRGVVNTDCRAHDLENLYVASSSVLPTSSQANPTFVTVALAIRLAEHIKRGRDRAAAPRRQRAARSPLRSPSGHLAQRPAASGPGGGRTGGGEGLGRQRRR